MSSYWAGYSGEALVLSNQEFQQFLQTYADVRGISMNELNEDLENETLREIPFAWSSDTNRMFFIDDITDDSCDGATIIPFYCNGRLNTPTFRSDGTIQECMQIKGPLNVPCYAIFADNQSQTVHMFEHKPYNSYDEMRQEFIDKLNAYLPPDFDYDSHIGIFSYAAFA